MQDDSNQTPIIPLRDTVVYPNVIVSLLIGRSKSLQALSMSMSTGKQVFLAVQKNPEQDNPKGKDLYKEGTLANILQLHKLSDGTRRVVVEGVARGKITTISESKGAISGVIEELPDIWHEDSNIDALINAVIVTFTGYVKENSKIPEDTVNILTHVSEPGRIADTVAMHLTLKVEDKQKILAIQDVQRRLEKVLAFLQTEIDLVQIERNIQERIAEQMDKGQREFYLNEKIKAIRKELGDISDIDSDLESVKERIKTAGMTKEAEEKALAELRKLRMTSPMAADYSVSRNYLDWLLDLPWKKRSKINKDLNNAEEILEADHYGLKKIKERITEYLAVQTRADKVKGPILCFVGPPGVGKTSLGKSIARATGREFIRISLGGVRDEAEIRGHRRTYVGSMPGKILQKMAKVKVKNPLFMLDEVDKMSMDFRGDPSAALLEVLDPEQNNTFSDHYMEVDYDLSDVMFITTANSLDIPDPLLDRMEVLNLEGYTEDEKFNIAIKYLIPKQIKENGLKNSEITITRGVVLDIIRYYTREAGVRGLEKTLAKICRKVVKEILLKPSITKKVITSKNLERYLGVKRYRYGLAGKYDQVGQVTGLAWTEVGGELLTIEVAIVSGKGAAIYTGSLGEVMQESIQAAVTVVRSRIDKLGIAKDFYSKHDIHVHVPEGATPKDGPSAGIGMCTALVSSLTKIPVKAEVAMTGEITLRGEVLPIGGLKEKLLAALRGGIKTVIIPAENKKDLKELPKNITNHLDIKPVQWIDEVLEIALTKMPKPKKKL